MNRGVLQSSPVQQMTAAGNPNWWNITASAARSPPSTHQFPPPLPSSNFQHFQAPQTYQYSNSNFALSSPPTPCNWDLENDNSNGNHTHQDQITSASWSQLFLSTGLVGDEEKTLINHFPEHQQAVEEHIKQENSSCGFVYANNEDNFQICNKPNNTTTTCWSPQSCITTTAATSKPDPPPAMVDRNSECNSAGIVHGGAAKKAKVQSCATQSTFKVRKFGDRITALHQLVSPFGKTDTASVLLEAIGYIRFLQGQIEALSLPYMGSGSGNNKRKQHPQSFKGEKNCIFPEDPGQLLHDNSLKRKGRPDQEEEVGKDLRSRGLCLVPVSCTLHVGRDNGADYWAPVLGGFR